MLLRLVWNSDERRLRAGPRLLLQVVVLSAIVLPLMWLVAAVAFELDHLPDDHVSIFALEDLAQHDIRYLGVLFAIRCLGVIVSLYLAARFLDRRRVRSFGLGLDRRWWLDCGFGVCLGGLLMSVIFVTELAAGWITIDELPMPTLGAPPVWVSVLTALGVFLAIGFYEEAFSRGYGLKNWAEGLRGGPLGARGAVITAWLVTSLLFGFGHGLNPNATLISCLGVAAAGLLLGLPVLLTGRLGVSVGLHFAWNFFQGTVYGFPVSGRVFGPSLVSIQQAGPEPWTGGAFGPEAGHLGLCACLLGGGLTLVWVRLKWGPLQLQTGLAEYAKHPVKKEENTNDPDA